jgi:hypothetical protein
MAGGLGLCGLNPRRLALHGTEVLPCWEAMPAALETPSVREGPGLGPRGRGGAVEARQPRTFVPVEELRAARDAGGDAPERGPVPTATTTAADRGWSLWGDPEA